MNELTLLPLDMEVETFLAEKAGAVRALGKRMVGDIIEIGRHLTEAKERIAHGGWLPWLEREFGWGDDTAINFMNVHAMAKSRNFRDLSIGASALYSLARDNTPEEVRDVVIEKAASGEKITQKDVKKAIDEALAKQRDADRAKIEKEVSAKAAAAAKELEKQIAAKDKALQKAQQELTFVGGELKTTSEEVKKLKTSAKADAAEIAKEKKALEAEKKKFQRYAMLINKLTAFDAAVEKLLPLALGFELPTEWPNDTFEKRLRKQVGEAFKAITKVKEICDGNA